jgi:hypothetical protein
MPLSANNACRHLNLRVSLGRLRPHFREAHCTCRAERQFRAWRKARIRSPGTCVYVSEALSGCQDVMAPVLCLGSERLSASALQEPSICREAPA